MNKFFRTAAFVAATVGLLTNASCKKNEEGDLINKGMAQTEQSMSPAEQKVLDFLQAYDDMNRGAKVEGEAMCPEDALWNWETTLNYCHGFSHEILGDLRIDTVRVAMPKANNDGFIDYNDALAAYGDIVDAVRDDYKAIDMDGKTLQFVMMDIENGTSRDGGDDIVITLTTGRNNGNDNDGFSTTPPYPWYRGPFVEGDNWIWGWNKGKCDGSVLTSDAAQQLTLAIGHYDTIHWAEYVPCHGCHPYFIVDPTLEASFENDGNMTWPFFASGLTYDEAQNYCIPWQDMNMYYEAIMQATHTENMVTNPFGYYGYYQTQVVTKIGIHSQSSLYTIKHHVKLYFATRGWRTDTGYPMPIDDTPAV